MKILPILVVEDDQDLLEAVCTTIQLSGYEAIPAANGQDALMTAYREIDKAITAMRSGACDYLLKPFEPDNLLVYIKRYALPEYDQDNAVIANDPKTRALLSLAITKLES